MEISSLLNSLLGRHSQARPDAPADITSIEHAKPGTRLTATVENVRDISATQKQTLLAQVNEELSRLKPGSNPPDPRMLSTHTLSARALSTGAVSPHPLPEANPANSTPSSIGAARLALATLARLELLTSSKLLLAEVKLLNDTHLVYTSRPLSVGQQIQIQVRTDGQLLLIDTPAKPTEAKVQIPGSPTMSAPTAISPPVANYANREAAELIAHGLRRYLPQTAPAVELFKTIATLVEVTKAIPESARPALLPEPVWNALTRLNQRALSPAQLQKPEVIQYVLKNSGQFFESRLSGLIRDNPPPGSRLISTPVVESKMNTAPREPLPATETRNSAESRSIQQIVDKDQKALLLSLAKVLTSIPTTNAGPVAAATQKNPGADLFSLLTILFNQLGRGLKVKQDQAQNQQQLVALLKGQVTAGIARIQTQQLQQLNHAAADSLAAPTGGMFEVPVKINENIFPLFIHIQEKPVKEKSEQEENKDKKNSPRKKSRRWHVFMEFDLDDLGWFASEINVCDNKVKTLFWAENTRTRNSARQKLEELQEKLKQSGVEVEELRCLEGEPPKRPTGIKQTLVDITT